MHGTNACTILKLFELFTLYNPTRRISFLKVSYYPKLEVGGFPVPDERSQDLLIIQKTKLERFLNSLDTASNKEGLLDYG